MLFFPETILGTCILIKYFKENLMKPLLLFDDKFDDDDNIFFINLIRG